MEHDVQTLRFFSDDERCADLINGVGFSGREVISPGDLSEKDSQILFRSGRAGRRRGERAGRKLYRDLIRKVAFGVNFVIIGIESQDEVHYLMPLRTFSYDAGEYERQAAKLRKKVRQMAGISKAEFLSGFRRSDRLKPCVTFVLYFGENWDGSKDLHGLLDWTDIPDEIKKLVGNYPLNLIEVRKLADTSVFKTDVRQVFDFIRYADDKEKLRELVLQDERYRTLEDDAYDLAAGYTKAAEFMERKEEYREGGKINMCKALTEMLQDERNEGRNAGRTEGRTEECNRIAVNMLRSGMPEEEVARLTELPLDRIRELISA